MKTKWRQRLRSTCKWGGVTLCVLLFALWFASGWYMIKLRLGTIYNPYGHLRFFSGTAEYYSREWATYQSFIDPSRSEITRLYGRRYQWWAFEQTSMGNVTAFPIWLPFLAIALPTGFLFWSNHRQGRPGHCAACGYNLTGNTTGRCPECGAEAVVVKKS